MENSKLPKTKELTDRDRAFYLNAGKKRSLESSKKKLKIGDLVSVVGDAPEDDLAWKIKDLHDDNTATIHLPNGREKRIPITRLFDTQIARDEAINQYEKDTLEDINQNNNSNN